MKLCSPLRLYYYLHRRGFIFREILTPHESSQFVHTLFVQQFARGEGAWPLISGERETVGRIS